MAEEFKTGQIRYPSYGGTQKKKNPSLVHPLPFLGAVRCCACDRSMLNSIQSQSSGLGTLTRHVVGFSVNPPIVVLHESGQKPTLAEI